MGQMFDNKKLNIFWHKPASDTPPMLPPTPVLPLDQSSIPSDSAITVEVDGELVTIDEAVRDAQKEDNSVLVQLDDTDDQLEVEIDDDQEPTSGMEETNVSVGVKR